MKVIKKLKKKLNNLGSSIIMVIVALGFIGIIVGALLSAASYAYRLKMQQMNAKDNFYYVEQAMQEVYVGVGTHTIEEMKGAYTYTIENMVHYNTSLGTYETIGDDEANKMFKKEFMTRIKNSAYFKQGTDKLADSLSNFISNDTVKLDKGKLSVVKRTVPYTDEDGNAQTRDEIIIKDVTLTRTEDYDKNLGEGTYTQTLSADILITEPDFEVKFTNLNTDYSVIFDYAVVADMGIEVNQGKTNNLTIVGNLYGGSDYYNKTYNTIDADTKLKANDVSEGKLKSTNGLSYENDKITGKYTITDPSYTGDGVISYDFISTSNKSTEYDSPSRGYVNDYVKNVLKSEEASEFDFNGISDRSRYSGIYVDNTNVSIMAENVVVPGTIAIMNEANLSIYGKSSATKLPQVWADDIVFGGTATKNNQKSTEEKEVYNSAEAMFRANLFVKDDMELNAQGASMVLNGSYYGYGNSTRRDDRVFFDTVNKKYFMIPAYNENGTIKTDASNNIVYEQNRGHFNSSAIVINGEDTSIDFSGTKELYVAGRSYIELSKYNTVVDNVDSETNVKTRTETYLYNPRSKGTNAQGQIVDTDFIRDYKTGESIAYKPSQLMYNVSSMGSVKTVTAKGFTKNNEFQGIELPEKLNGVVGGVETFFPKVIFDGYIPVVTQNIPVKNTNTTRAYSFIDFETGYNFIKAASQSNAATAQAAAAREVLRKFKTLDEYVTGYAIFYASEAVKGDESLFYPELTDISTYDDFSMGDIDIDLDSETNTQTKAYSSGAISVRTNNKFTMTTADDDTVITNLLKDDTVKDIKNNVADATTAPEDMVTAAFNLTNDLALEFSYMKWNLAHFEENDIEKQYISDVVNVYGEAALTPLNKYMVFKNFDPSKAPNNNANYKVEGYSINGSNGDATYKIWASSQDIVVEDMGDITGIIVCKGDVTFGKGVTSFTGMVVSGGKVYFNGPMQSLVASPQTCREIMKQCKANIDDERCEYFLNLFAQYAKSEDAEPDSPIVGDDDKCDIDTVTYSDIVSMQNWTTSVGGVENETTTETP